MNLREESGSAGPESPLARVVLLGASNLTLGISTVLETARLLVGSPLEVMGAFGHGRSYGIPSSVLGRTLPGIVECGLWEALRQKPPRPLYALLTDIGNDILYGVPVPRISGWVEWCLDRLGERGARAVLTLLPMCRIRSMRWWKYYVFRTILYPTKRLPFSEALSRCEDLDRRLRDLGAERSIPLAEPRAEWYGQDPIHIRMRFWRAAWAEILARLYPEGRLQGLAKGSVRRWAALLALAPERRWILGIERTRHQPSGRLRDGTTISLY